MKLKNGDIVQFFSQDEISSAIMVILIKILKI